MASAAALLLAVEAFMTSGQAGAAAPPPPAKDTRTAAQPEAVDVLQEDLAWASRYPGTIAHAIAEATRSGKKVEVADETTATSRTWALPDGQLTTELAAGPVRMQRGGDWVDIDVDLAETADGVAAKAHPQGLKLAGAVGTPARSLAAAQDAPARDLVTLGTGQDQVTLQWQGGLPEPELDGHRARYKEAVPGADVIVEATRTGFEQFVEIHEKPSGAYAYNLPLKAKGLDVKENADGSVTFTDTTTGDVRATMPAPVMWDATVDKVSGEHTRRVDVDMKVVDHGAGTFDLVVTPDAKFLADPRTRYPVTVDPSTSALSNTFDTYVQQGETKDWSTDTELDLGNPGTKNADGTPRLARSFISWNTTPIQDALVSNADVSLWNFHSGNTDCKPQEWTVWDTGAPSTASRWSAQPAWNQQFHSSTATKGNADCTAAPDGWISADVTKLVQTWASAKAAKGHMGLRAATDDVKGWKRVNSANNAANPPKLSVTYNYRPQSGDKQQAGPPFKSYAGVWAVNTTTPTLRDTFDDKDGDKVNGTFQIYDAATDKPITTPAGQGLIVSEFGAQGKPVEVKVPAGQLKDGKAYKFRTNAYDGTHYNTDWSPWRQFVVDTTAPGEPTKIASALYPEDMPGGGKGIQDRFDVETGAGDAREVQYRLDVPDTEPALVAQATAWQGAPTTNGGLNASFSAAPAADGVHAMQVRSVDRADNVGTTREYGFMSPAIDTNRANKIDIELPDPDTNIDTTKPFVNDPLPAAWLGHGYRDVAARGGQALAADPLKPKSNSYTAKGKDGHTYTATTTLTPRKAEKVPDDAVLKAPRARTALAAGDPVLPILDGWCKPENKFDPNWPSLFTRNEACLFGTLEFTVERKDAPGIKYTQLFETVYAVHTARDSHEIRTWFQVTPWNKPSPNLPFTNKPGVLDMDIRSLCASDGCDDADKIRPYTCTGDPEWSGPGTIDNHTTTCEATHTWNGKTVNAVKGTSYTDDLSHSMKLTFGWGGKFDTTMFEGELEKVSDAISPDLPISCDDVYKPTGCVISTYPPGYVVNVAKYPAAAAHIWLVSQRHAKKLGASPATPLHYLPAIDRNRVGRETEDKLDPMGRLPGNRKAVCGRAWRKHPQTSKHDELVKPKPDGSRTPDSISCDEFPFAKSWESPGFPAGTPYGGLNPAKNTEYAGLECVQSVTIKRDGKDHFLNDTRYDDPKQDTICGRSSMSGYTNSGSMSAFGLRFAPEFRLLDLDAYWVDVDSARFKDCDATKDVVKCKMG
ncbi:DNRLRE domain-containing protein [Streptomyces sp. NPDC056323]|uniref:DNRLRE domain-containing protein n=1 Tax=Streptomyces sp. NPDC056323 TaxID=3345784 RepID=UPI0035D88B0D